MVYVSGLCITLFRIMSTEIRNTAIPRLTRLIHSSKVSVRRKLPTEKLIFHYSIRQTFLSEHTKFTLIVNRKYLSINKICTENQYI